MSISQIGGLNLYIGGIFGLQQSIENAKITHVLSLVHVDRYLRMISNADPDLFQRRNIRHLTIPVEDSVDEDLLRHFRDTNLFIHSGLEQEGRVLVHCGVGISLSAAICIAYLLHRNPTKFTPDSTLSLVRRSRSNCQPNDGFMKQLWLYHQMGCCLDPTDNILYNRWKGEGGLGVVRPENSATAQVSSEIED